MTLTGTVTQQFSPTHPATIRVRLSNRSDTEQRVSYGAKLPLSPGPIPRRNGDERIHLVPADGRSLVSGEPGAAVVPAEPADGCWTVPVEEYTVRTKGTPPLAPGETVEREYAVLDGRADDACLVAGRYSVAGEDDARRPEHEAGFGLVLGSPSGGDNGSDDTATTDERATSRNATDGTETTDEPTDHSENAASGGSGTAKAGSDETAETGGNGKAKQGR